MKKRKSIRPKKRFEVFERDNFTCQYCGKTPETEGVILEVDHIVSIKDGGENNLENLVTSCWECNIGKGAKSKPKKTIEQIEENIEREEERISQLKLMNNRNRKLIKLKKEAKDLSRSWIYDEIGTDYVDTIYSAIEKAATKYGKEIAKEALEVIKGKEISEASKWIKYFQGICRNLALPEKEREVLAFYAPYLHAPYDNGRYDWRVKQSYEAAKKVIHEYFNWGDEFHNEVITAINDLYAESRGETFKSRDLTRAYTNERYFTIYKTGKNANLLLIDTMAMIAESWADELAESINDL